jgi:hypothetical protein
MSTKPTIPESQTLGTAYNLRPRTIGVRAADLLPGHVVVESADCPAVVVRILPLYRGRSVRIFVRYVWSAATEPAWDLGAFLPDFRIPTARKGQY